MIGAKALTRLDHGLARRLRFDSPGSRDKSDGQVVTEALDLSRTVRADAFPQGVLCAERADRSVQAESARRVEGRRAMSSWRGRSYLWPAMSYGAQMPRQSTRAQRGAHEH